jgi:hypothetical protein
MLLDKVLATTLKSFSTFFLIVAVVTVPLQLAYSFVYRDVLAVSELHSAIARLPPAQAVGGVTSEALRKARLAYLALCGLEVLFIPLLWRATSRVIALDRSGRLPTTLEAWRWRRIETTPHRPPEGGKAIMVVGAVLFSVVLWFLVERIGMLATEIVPERYLFIALGLVRSVSVAAAAPFALVAAVYARRTDTAPG